MFILLIHQSILRCALNILLQVATKHKLRIFQRLIVNQPVQFRPLIHIVGNLVFHGDGVNGNDADIKEFQLYTGSVNVELTRNQSIHKKPPFYGMLDHPKIFECFSDCFLFFWRTLGLSGILRFW